MPLQAHAEKAAAALPAAASGLDQTSAAAAALAATRIEAARPETGEAGEKQPALAPAVGADASATSIQEAAEEAYEQPLAVQGSMDDVAGVSDAGQTEPAQVREAHSMARATVDAPVAPPRVSVEAQTGCLAHKGAADEALPQTHVKVDS